MCLVNYQVQALCYETKIRTREYMRKNDLHYRSQFSLCVTISSPIVRIYSQVADLGSAYKLAPQSPGLPQTERLSIGVLKSILKLREVGSLSVRTIYSFPKRSSDQTYVNKHQQT